MVKRERLDNPVDMGDLEEEFNIKWNNHSTEALYIVNQLRTHEAFADVLLYCEDNWFKANKMILAACSGYFQRLFLEMQAQGQTRVPAVVAMRETRSDLLQLALDFMYKGEVLVPSAALGDFMDFAEDMKIRGLRRDPGLPNVVQSERSVLHINNNTIKEEEARSAPVAKKPRISAPAAGFVVREAQNAGSARFSRTVEPDARGQVVEVQSEDEMENEENFVEEMNDDYDEDIPEVDRDEAEDGVDGEDGKVMPNSMEGSPSGEMPAYIPPDISTEEPVTRVTEVTWRGTHRDMRAAWHFCGLCGYNARYQAALMRHERVHTGEKPFKCCRCDRRFTTKYWQQYHQRNSHPELGLGGVKGDSS